MTGVRVIDMKFFTCRRSVYFDRVHSSGVSDRLSAIVDNRQGSYFFKVGQDLSRQNSQANHSCRYNCHAHHPKLLAAIPNAAISRCCLSNVSYSPCRTIAMPR